MYAYVRGEDEHLCFEWLRTRKEAEKWLKEEKFLNEICYSNPDCGILTNKEFFMLFPDDKYKNKSMWRRLGNQLRARIEEQQNRWK